MSEISWILKRKSVRNFLDKPVPRETLEWILKAGMAAPAAVNQQLWEFLVIDNKEVLLQIGESLPYAKMLLHAPAAIVVCGNLNKTFDGNSQSPYWIMDCSAATENILLAVESFGLGAVWTAVYPDQARIESVRNILHLPESVIPLNVIPLGYPAKDELPKEKWNPNVVHWNEW